MAGREDEIETNEILENVDEHGDHHLARDDPEGAIVTHDEEKQEVDENLSGVDEYDQIFDEPLDDVDGDGDHHLAIDHPEAINVERDGKKQRLEEKFSSIDCWLKGETEFDQLFGQTHLTDYAIGPDDMPPEQGIQMSEPAAVVDKGKQIVIYAEKKTSAFKREAGSEFRQFNEQTEPGYTLGPTHASSSADVLLLPDQGLQRLDPATVAPEIIENSGVDENSVAEAEYEAFKKAVRIELERENSEAGNVAEEIEDITVDEEVLFLNVQEVNRICKAAYTEFMKMVVGKSFWSKPDPVGMRVELTGQMADVPVTPEILVSIMMDVDKWASSMSDIVCRASGRDLPGVRKILNAANKRIQGVKMVNAEVRLPTPLVKTRKFCFLRFLKLINPDIWAIVDISNDCIERKADGSKLEKMSRKRPSGVIIKRHERNSKIIWIENVEVDEPKLEDNMYSTLVNSQLVFCAKHWVKTLLQKMKRNDFSYSSGPNTSMDKYKSLQARTYLLELCTHMKKIFLECAHEYPDENKFTVLSDEEGIRILKTTLDLDSYVGLTSFHVKAKLIPTFDYLIRRDIELEWPNLRNQEGPELIIKLASEDTSNCITVYRRLVSEHDSPKVFELIVQEISRNDFCSYVISSPLNLQDYNSFCLGERKPSGFAIMPDGSRGLQSDASLVTVVAHKQLGIAEANRAAIDIMTDVVTTTMGEIKEAVAEGDRDSNETS